LSRPGKQGNKDSVTSLVDTLDKVSIGPIHPLQTNLKKLMNSGVSRISRGSTPGSDMPSALGLVAIAHLWGVDEHFDVVLSVRLRWNLQHCVVTGGVGLQMILDGDTEFRLFEIYFHSV